MLTVVMVLLVVVAVATILSVLLQSGYAAGLSGAIAGAGQQMFGKKKGLDELLERATMVLGVILMVLTTIAANLWR